ncbi:hypothetical protein F5144DRAFT_593659 [Chaetomium tenue]|uniref:Uncharacterized protein n=1 Tax=Chaetomium tenue TaxID=1854479 RepID=A0ACB7P4B0_9PEZI|nr:hypothetical protein F5144DRAFT_593659 [Chaetomium globosum]
MPLALTPTFCRSASSDGTEARIFDPTKCRSNSQAQFSLARLPRHGMIKYRGTLPNNSPSSLFRLFREATAQQGSRENRAPVAGGSISNHRLTGGFPVPAHNVSLGCQVARLRQSQARTLFRPA